MDRAGIVLDYPNMRAIPIYGLYGEFDTDPAHEWLHWETIQERSRMHDYAIAPHRHEQFFQLLLLRGGSGEVTIDGQVWTLAPTCIVVVPALSVHAYRFSPDVEGIVLTLMERDVRAVGLGDIRPGLVAGDGVVAGAMAQLIAEADRPGPGHAVAMQALLALLVLAIRRTAEPKHAVTGGGSDRALAHVQAFRVLVDQRFRGTRAIGDYAKMLGISATHLNRVCRQVLGMSALAVIERRMALEARRQLLFSTLSVKQIASELGYDDPAYFSRVMHRLLGQPPAKLRRRGQVADGLGSPELAKAEMPT